MARWLVLALVLAVLGDVGPAIAAEPRLPRNWVSRMGDYNDLLTVRDLLDLVEFLKGVR